MGLFDSKSYHKYFGNFWMTLDLFFQHLVCEPGSNVIYSLLASEIRLLEMPLLVY